MQRKEGPSESERGERKKEEAQLIAVSIVPCHVHETKETKTFESTW